MSSDYLKKPILAKTINYKICEGFAYTSCEMQGINSLIKDGEGQCRMPSYVNKLFKECIYSLFLMGMEDLKSPITHLKCCLNKS